MLYQDGLAQWGPWPGRDRPKRLPGPAGQDGLLRGLGTALRIAGLLVLSHAGFVPTQVWPLFRTTAYPAANHRAVTWGTSYVR